jgi:hypothetical protein
MAGSYVVPDRVRLAILRGLASQRSPSELASHIRVEFGFDDLDQLPEAMDVTGQAAAADIAERIQRLKAQLPAEDSVALALSMPDEEVVAKIVLLAVPDAVFAIAVDHGIAVLASYSFDYGMSTEPAQRLQHRIEQMLAINGIPFSFGSDGRLSPSGSRVAAELSLAPAYDVLDDARFSDSRRHLSEAIQRLGEPDEAEAVDEARMAVEAGMLAVIDSQGVARPARRQPQELFNALVNAGVLSRDVEELVLATPRFRGRTEAGHAGGAPVTRDEAEAAVAGAAAALVLRAGRLGS